MSSSGDVLADRRYAYAEAAFADDDLDVAADLARQALELAPGYAPAWLLLGRALERQGAEVEAVAAYRHAREFDPADVLGAGLYLARLGAAEAGTAMAPAYVEKLFDEYAVRFDRHLREGLGYRGPEILRDAVRRACSLLLREPRFGAALDLGCGTGLAGEAFREMCGSLAGIDLSAAMMRRAAAKRVYNELATGDLVRWMDGLPARSADLVLAADVFVYMADLRPAFGAVGRVLRPGGLFALTVQATPEGDVVLGDDHRYAHGEAYLTACADEAGMFPVVLEQISTRRDRGLDVPGLVAILSR